MDAPSTKKVHIVEGDDWQRIYLNGKAVYENHGIETSALAVMLLGDVNVTWEEGPDDNNVWAQTETMTLDEWREFRRDKRTDEEREIDEALIRFSPGKSKKEIEQMRAYLMTYVRP